MFPEGRILDFAIVGVIALIVVGPKDLPVLMRKVGRYVAKMRAMAAEFRASFDEMARHSELDELRREVEAMRAGQTLKSAVGLGPGDEGGRMLDDIRHTLTVGDEQPDLPFGPEPPTPEAVPELPKATLEPFPDGEDAAVSGKAQS